MKTILVQLSGTGRDDHVLACANAIGHRFASHLTCLRTEPDALAMVGYLTGLDMAPPIAIGETVAQIQKETRDRTRRAEQTFMAHCKAHDIARVDEPPPPHHMSASWVKREGEEIDVLTAEVRSHDAAVLSGGEAKRGLTAEDLGSVIISAGRPVLLAPETDVPERFRTIVVAWKNTPEAARAITAAMPLLETAEQVLVLAAAERATPVEALANALAPVVKQLRWHGIRAEGRVIVPDGRVLDALLKAAAESHADLLVIGAYGHSRFRELIFGGVTEDVLKGVPLPVLMAH